MVFDDPTSRRALLKGVTWAGALGIYAFVTKKLTLAASCVAFGVGTVTVAAGPAPHAALLVFFLSSTKITKFGADVKRRIDRSYGEHSTRSVSQVICNSLPAVLVVMLGSHHMGTFGGWWSFPASECARVAAVAHFAACQGDTWSSEIGVLSQSPPRLILGWRQVPRGTNGAVSLLGLVASAAGGLLVGLSSGLAHHFFSHSDLHQQQVRVGRRREGTVESIAVYVAVGVLAAVAGSVIDSVLGQLLQRSILSRDGHSVLTPEEAQLEETAGSTHGGEKVGTPTAPRAVAITGTANILNNDSVNLVSSTLVTLAAYLWAGWE